MKICKFRYTTILDYPSPLGVRIPWKTPDSCVSGKVDIFRKKNYQKILSFKKVTANLIFKLKKKFEKNHFEDILDFLINRLISELIYTTLSMSVDALDGLCALTFGSTEKFWEV